MTIDSSSTSLSIGVYSDTSVLSIMATELHMILSTTTSASSPRYVLKFGVQATPNLMLDRFGPPGSDSANVKQGVGALSSSNWRMFGVDFSGTWIAVNVGNLGILQYNDATPIQVNYVSFYNPGSTKATVLYCNRQGNKLLFVRRGVLNTAALNSAFHSRYALFVVLLSLPLNRIFTDSG